MEENWDYVDLVKAHKILMILESRFKYYSVYMDNRKPEVWLESDNVPLKEVLLLFGWIHSWDPNYNAEITKFLIECEKIFPSMKRLKHRTIIDVKLTKEKRAEIALIFDTLADCCRIPWRKKVGKFESTDTSKALHGMIPELFVMWDDRIKEKILGIIGKGWARDYDGKVYADKFLPLMQSRAKQVLDSYVNAKGGSCSDAGKEISKLVDGFTLAKIVDEFNYLRFTKNWSIAQIRTGKKDSISIDFRDLKSIL